jgi:hypothetical protein
MIQFLNMSFLYIVLSIFGSLHISRSPWNLKYGTLSKKHKMEILTMVIKQYQVSGNEIKMKLKD